MVLWLTVEGGTEVPDEKVIVYSAVLEEFLQGRQTPSKSGTATWVTPVDGRGNSLPYRTIAYVHVFMIAVKDASLISFLMCAQRATPLL